MIAELFSGCRQWSHVSREVPRPISARSDKQESVGFVNGWIHLDQDLEFEINGRIVDSIGILYEYNEAGELIFAHPYLQSRNDMSLPPSRTKLIDAVKFDAASVFVEWTNTPPSEYSWIIVDKTGRATKQSIAPTPIVDTPHFLVKALRAPKALNTLLLIYILFDDTGDDDLSLILCDLDGNVLARDLIKDCIVRDDYLAVQRLRNGIASTSDGFMIGFPNMDFRYHVVPEEGGDGTLVLCRR